MRQSISRSARDIPPRRAIALVARLWRDRRGVTAIITALAGAALLGFTGLAVDVGYWEAMQRTAQGAADQAAMAATLKLEEGAPSSDVVTEGKSVAAHYGYVDGQGGVAVTVNNPPTSGSYAGNDAAVEVIITTPAPTFFARLFLK